MSQPEGRPIVRRFVIRRHSVLTECRSCGGFGTTERPDGTDLRVCIDCHGAGAVLGSLTSKPWVMRDRQRPAWLGHYSTFDDAIEAMITKLRAERGLPPRIRWEDDLDRRAERARMRAAGVDMAAVEPTA